MRTLLIFPGLHHFRLIEQQAREANDASPRASLFQVALNGDVLDDLYLRSHARFADLLRRLHFIPAGLVKALVAFRHRREYDVVVTWDDRFALIYALLLMLSRSRSRHVAILSWMAPPKKAFALRFVQKHMDRVIVWSQSHKDLLVEFFGVSPSRIVVIPYWVDQGFFRPLGAFVEGICSVGDSRRDYATLIEAVRDLDVTCRIVTKLKPHVKSNPDYDATSTSLGQVDDLPGNIVYGPASPLELRTVYARARFVVVPLFPTFRDSGITTVTEAMAMGKAIICSRIYGQMDLLEDGVNGIFVPPGDPQALRQAIQYLLEHPDVAAQMGAEGRRRAEEVFALDHFVANVRQIVCDVITGSHTFISQDISGMRGAITPPVRGRSEGSLTGREG